MLDGCMDVRQVAYRALGRRPAAAADGCGALRRTAPAAFEFIECSVEFAPLATGEEAPFERVLQPIVVGARFAPRDLGAGPLNVEAIEDAVLPGTVVGALADQTVKPPPVAHRNRLLPAVQVGKDDAHAPERAGVTNMRQ